MFIVSIFIISVALILSIIYDGNHHEVGIGFFNKRDLSENNIDFHFTPTISVNINLKVFSFNWFNFYIDYNY